MSNDLSSWRDANSISTARAAATIGVSIGTWSRWETGRRRVPAERVLDIERATGIARHLIRPDLYPAPDGAALPPSLASSPSEPQPVRFPAASPAGASDIPPAGEPLQHEVV